MPLCMEVSLGPGDIVLDGHPAPPPPKEHSPSQFSANVYCAQTAGYIKMPLGMEVSLDPSEIVLYGDPSPPPQRGGHSRPPQFLAHVYCGQTVVWIKIKLGM